MDSTDKTLQEKISLAMDLNVLMTVQDIARETKKSTEEVLLEFMESNTAKMAYDDSTKLWSEGPAATAEEYMTERKN